MLNRMRHRVKLHHSIRFITQHDQSYFEHLVHFHKLESKQKNPIYGTVILRPITVPSE
jgi:hypothetical protein